MRAVLVALIRAQAAPVDAPLVPASWDVVPEAGRWSTVYPLGREAQPDAYIHARLMYRPLALRGVFVCVAPPLVLQRLADRIAADALSWTRTWSGVAALRADAGADATTIKAAWPDERTVGDLSQRVMLRAAMAGFLDDNGEGA